MREWWARADFLAVTALILIMVLMTVIVTLDSAL